MKVDEMLSRTKSFLRMKNTLTIIGTFLFANCFGQLGSSSQSITTFNDSIELIQTANFSIGSGPTCPSIDNYSFNILNNTLIFDIYYNVQGAWPQNGCTQIDTLKEQAGFGTFDVIVNAYVIGIDSTYRAESDTTYLVSLSIKELFKPQKQLDRIINTMGKDSDEIPNTLLIYIYKDGTTEKVFRVE